MHRPDSPAGPSPECGGCTIGRRLFVADVSRSVALLLGIAIAPRLLPAMPVAGGELDERRYPIPTGEGVFVDEAASVILARRGTAVYAFSLACPHKRTALRWQERNDRFECPRHKSRYRPDGTFISGRATRSMDRFAIRRDGAFVVVDLARLHREDRDRAAWQASMVQV